MGPLPRAEPPVPVPFCLEFFNLNVLDNFGSFVAAGYGYEYDDYADYFDVFGPPNPGLKALSPSPQTPAGCETSALPTYRLKAQ